MPRGALRGPRKSIFDPIHGLVTLSGAPLELIGDPAFQRLWGIRQTGLANLVFPGANHTRLEHSLGTYWVAGRMAESLELEDREVDLVAVGGLLHDLGHGPLSHTLDGPMEEALGVTHERRTREIVTGTDSLALARPGATPSEIPAILERYAIRPRTVADLVDPAEGRERQPLLRSLLHGPIDADRIDYLQRDAHYTGVGHGAIDAARLLDTLLLASNRLAFAEKGRSAIEGFLVGRALMYSAVYYHKTVRAAEVMAEGAVERLPGYPGSARSIFAGTDAELFARLEGAGGRPAEIARALLERRLYRRAHGWRVLKPDRRRAFERLAAHPAERRAREDEVAERIGAGVGSVLLDLSGLGEPDRKRDDWMEVILLEDGHPTHPFASRGTGLATMLRPPAAWPVSVYVERRHEGALRSLMRRRSGLFA